MSTDTGSKQFGAFKGVFIPTFLSIVGVILFLRLGQVIGSVGLLGALIIIILSISVTLSTGLSLSSISSNVRIGAGGAYSIINKTLGLEIGGSIGIPLYLAQAFSVALYIFGFSETWNHIFPGHPVQSIALISFIFLLLLTFVSTKLAVKFQFLVFIAVLTSLLSIFLGVQLADISNLSFEIIDNEFWLVFAVFFPAATGLMAGIGMSGELSDPKRQIPKGILWGLGASTVIYITTAFILALSGTSSELLTNPFILVEIAAFPQLAMAGILAAMISSALTAMIAAPRVLEALAKSGVLPASRLLTAKEGEEEPRNAVLLTGLIIFPVIIGGSLDSVAQVLTMFFLITYVTINTAVFLEQFLGLRSFRPTFKVPKMVPMYGALGSAVIMFLINVYATLVAIGFVFFVYFLLTKKTLPEQKGDVRSGIFRAFSEWAAEKSRRLPESSLHIWKPNMIIPVLSTKTLAGNFPLIKAIANPRGRMTVLGFKLTEKISENPEEKDITGEEIKREIKQLPEFVKKFNEEKIFTSYSTINATDYISSLIVSIEAIYGQVFSPNILFLPYDPGSIKPEELKKVIDSATEKKYGLILFDKDKGAGLGAERDIDVWISPKVLKEDIFEERHYDLSLLTAYSIKQNWKGAIRLRMCVEEKNVRKAEKYLYKLIYEARLPYDTEVVVSNENFKKELEKVTESDLQIFPFEKKDIPSIYEISKVGKRSNLFILDSTKESVLA